MLEKASQDQEVSYVLPFLIHACIKESISTKLIDACSDTSAIYPLINLVTKKDESFLEIRMSLLGRWLWFCDTDNYGRYQQ